MALPLKPSPVLLLAEFVPVVNSNYSIVVVGIALAGGSVVLVQEAKAACRGSWYLPAGHVERHEDLLTAVRREFLEESGLIFEPSGLILVETSQTNWIRFVFIGDVVGGTLKKAADKESLQAAWIPFGKIEEAELKHVKGLQLDDSHSLRLRAPIMRLISQASMSQACISRLDLPPPSILPVDPDNPLTGVFLRLLVEVRHQAPQTATAASPSESTIAATTNAHYVITTNTDSRFPLIRVNHKTIKQAILRFLKTIFSGLGYEVTTRPTTSPNHLFWSPNSTAVIGVEFSGTPRKAVEPTDGLCLTLFLSLLPPPLGSTATTNQQHASPFWQSQTTCALATGFLLCHIWHATGNVTVSLSQRDKGLLFSLPDLHAGTCCRISLPS
nr:unnamed protein product [Spirometra erinaceieuropaei]